EQLLTAKARRGEEEPLGSCKQNLRAFAPSRCAFDLVSFLGFLRGGAAQAEAGAQGRGERQGQGSRPLPRSHQRGGGAARRGGGQEARRADPGSADHHSQDSREREEGRSLFPTRRTVVGKGALHLAAGSEGLRRRL